MLTAETESALMLSPLLADIEAAPGRWYAAHVKSRQEKALASDCRDRGIAYFLPLQELLYTKGRLRRVVLAPLFPGYVFIAGDEHTPPLAMATGRVCQTIRVADQARVRWELANLYRCLSANPRVERCPFAVEGKRVRVASGALEGVEGVVVRRGRGSLLVISVTGFGNATVDIDSALLEAA